MPLFSTLENHYGNHLDGTDFQQILRDNIEGPIRCSDLAPLDQLHLGGREASESLLSTADLKAGDRLLDLGCGLGGTARLAAETFGVEAIGLDLTHALVAGAQQLSAALSTPVNARFLQGNALALPFPDQYFETVVMQHCLLNLPEPETALRECRRVLKPNGQLILHEVLQGPGGIPYYPVPWAASAEQSFLVDQTTLCGWLNNGGFNTSRIDDLSEQALNWRTRHSVREHKGLRPFSVQLIFGDAFASMAKNLRLNLAEQRVRVIALHAVRDNVKTA